MTTTTSDEQKKLVHRHFCWVCVCVQPELGLVSSGTTSSARAIIALFNKYPSLFSDFPLFLIFFFQNILFINNNNSRPKC